jgi:hypothetical protein
MQLRDYQNDIAGRAAEMLRSRGVCYLSMQVRTGKTFTAMQACSLYGAKRVLFVSKLKALGTEQEPGSIRMDYQVMQGAGAGYSIEFINWESLHKVQAPEGGYCVVILDEAHTMGQYPRPNQRTEQVNAIQARAHLLLSGTPTPESTSQLFHQFRATGRGPWEQYRNFYEWHKVYGEPWERYINGRMVKQYNRCKDTAVLDDAKRYMISYTQEEAGFKCEVTERVETVPMPSHIATAIRLLRRDKLFHTRSGDMVVADTAVKEMQKIHQLCGGTVITERGERIVADRSKAEWIKREWSGRKIAVFYKYQAECNALAEVLGGGCSSPEQFAAATGPAHILLQIAAGREGVNLSSADALIMYNIDFAAVSYWQARARLQSLNRATPALVIWLQYDGGIESKILAAVHDKKDYTLQHYRRDLFSV